MAGVTVGRWMLVAVAAAVLAACSGGGPDVTDLVESIPPTPPTADGSDPAADAATEGSPADSAAADADAAPAATPDADILIDAGAPTIPIDDRLFGTNLPAWIGPGQLADERFRAAVDETGTTLLRMPGGSWSNSYDWLGCEQGDQERCWWLWASRPSDFVGFLAATGLPGSWTVNINQTAQAAAAAVAFFNGDPADERPIGVDRDGVDWGTVGRWAQLRVDGGNVEPAGIDVWEVGNEVYGGKPDAGGEQCAPFGWEDVWTCDGAEYALGDDDHDGYLAIRSAMIAVDPDIEVGAVGVAPPSEWSDFGREVIEAAGDDLDFYVVHRYGFDQSPEGSAALYRPAEMWPGLIDAVRAELGADVPIAVTEYNLVAFQTGDTERSMTTSQNALYIADTVGQLAAGGVAIANQWDLANGDTGDGTDYGLFDGVTLEPYPQAAGMRAWADVGSALLPATTQGDLHVYPTQHDDGRLTVVVVNLSESGITRSLAVTGTERAVSGELSSVRTDDLTAATMITDEPVPLDALDTPTDVTFPGWSISRLELSA